MPTLLLKDLRLSLDALRPWALIVAGFAVSMFAFSYLPTTIVPRSLQGLSVGELLNLVGLLVGASAIAVSAWAVSAVVQGDRKRGALSLALVVPKSGMRIVGSKLFAILLAVLVPLSVAVTLQLSGSAMMGTTLRAPGNALLIPPIVALAVFIGAAFALIVAPLVRGMFAAVAIALLLGIVAALFGWFGEEGSFWLIARNEIAAAVDSKSTWELFEIRDHAAFAAVMSGTIAASIPSLIIGSVFLARARSRRMTYVAGLVVLGCAFIGGIVGTAVSVEVDPTRVRWQGYWRHYAGAGSDAEIAAAAESWMAIDRAGGARYDDVTKVQCLIDEGHWRVRALPPAARNLSPIAQAFKSAQDYRWPSAALWSYRLEWGDDPSRLATYLECLVRWPDYGGGAFRDRLFVQLRGRNIEMDASLPQIGGVPAYHAAMDVASREELTRLMRANPPERDLMLQAIEALKHPRPD